jgi:methyl-accepting chemotaxis protein
MRVGINEMLDGITAPIDEASAVIAKMAEGDLTARVEGDYRGDHARLKGALNATLDSLNELVGQVAVAIDQIGSSAEQVSSSAQALSRGAAEQASAVEEITSSLEEMTTQTRLNAENASQANQLAISARDKAEAGDGRMKDMVGAMAEINDSSGNIAKIIKVIDEIAFQTNLLALNAAVEAARAGRHGKGFAVVAEEVRNLAMRSARAAKETTELIEGSIKKVENGTEIAHRTAQALQEIVSGVTKVTDLVGEIASASREQAQGIRQVNQAVGQVDQVTQRNAASSEESAAAAEELSSQSRHLKQMVGRFELREDGVAADPLAGLSPEVIAELRRLLLGQGNGGNGKRARAPRQPEPATVPWGRRKAAAKQAAPPEIDLDDEEFGKF